MTGSTSPLTIGVLGGGRVGSALAGRWRLAGHDVRVSTRETIVETARGADVILLAVPAASAPEALEAAALPPGTVVVDATNNLSGGPDGRTIASLVPDARTVKAFNTVFARYLADPPTPPPSLVIAGDDDGAKRVVSHLARDAGFEPVDAGGSERIPLVEALAHLVIGIAYGQGRGPFVYRFEP